MIKGKRTLLALMLVAAMVAVVACNRSSGNEDTELQSTGGVGLPLSTTAPGEGALSAAGLSSLQVVAGNQLVGISVSGTGTVTVAPDTAILTLGVQARRDTVVQARNDAAIAMTNIVQVLEDNGVAEEDIKTQFLSIQPVYNYRVDPPELDGFDVVNTVRVKIRDLDSVGVIIDGVVDAGGDLTRVQGIGFTVDDPSPFMAELRQMAVQDAVAKAQQLASLTGVTLGAPISISEGGGATPVFDVGVRAFAEAAAAPTPVSPGEMELRLNVSIVFAIQ
ncbi:MAG: SIMPL domain-containing protein [Dehalococcoidia bacterium]